MISSIAIRFGHTGDLSVLTFRPEAIVIFVGPNNAGKSLLLREIDQFFYNGAAIRRSILDQVELDIVEQQTAFDAAFEQLSIEPEPGENVSPDVQLLGQMQPHGFQTTSLSKVDLNNWRGRKLDAFYKNFVKFFVARMDAQTRFQLTDEKPFHDMLLRPKNILHAAFINDAARIEIRDVVRKAIGKIFVLDPTSIGKLRIRLADRDPVDTQEEQCLDQRARSFHSTATPINEFSDGIRAFIGLILATKVSDIRCLLIDEPEAFLHPSLSRTLAIELSDMMAKKSGNLIAATHDPHFLMGCIQSGQPINIVRLTYANETSTATLLPANELSRWMRDPLLRSTGVMEALFYNQVIVAEGDTDRAFYQEINERLLKFDHDSGISDCLFLNAQNKQTIRRIVGPLRQLGIPACAVIDLDIVKDGGLPWRDLMIACEVPTDQRDRLARTRAELLEKLNNSGRDWKKDGGLDVLQGADRQVYQDFLCELAEYGIFVTPCGELEGWLRDLSITGHGPDWLLKMFEAMGDDPNDPSYVKPKSDDVWQFVRSMDRWFEKKRSQTVK